MIFLLLLALSVGDIYTSDTGEKGIITSVSETGFTYNTELYEEQQEIEEQKEIEELRKLSIELLKLQIKCKQKELSE